MGQRHTSVCCLSCARKGREDETGKWDLFIYFTRTTTTNPYKIGAKEKHQEKIMLNYLPGEEMRKLENVFISKPSVTF